uniref:Conserved hypothetical chloroplast protein ycf2 n=1 Tax=Lindsaea linearis TaxID=641179 RepID=A0A5B9REC5_9MONI|nr:conserved hypothetical chloroplast protein ycf2 [Lindsaea linearis]YP_009690629.1 conserved hypothetical chloroplast protein ycf2 [Lindsaea linearis]QEG57393.1 conserved hypothetical chloroplast protein ycf2 [Lindsaea linearis]QEG57409.1 conserved hypothetical chloroplast protein ycf2 [Lindsaea linearis]
MKKKKRNEVKEVGKKEIGSPDYFSLSKFLELAEVSISNYFFNSLKNQHLKEFLIGPSSSYKPFIRLFDLRFLGSVFVRNIHHLIGEDSSVTSEIVMLLAIPIYIYCLSDKSSLERSFLPTKLIHGGVGIRKKQAENYGDFPYDCFLQFKRSLSVEKGENKSDYLSSNKNIYTGSTKGEKQARYHAMNPLVSGRWKICIARNSLFEGDIFKGETERTQVFCRDRYLRNSSIFLTFYNHMGVTRTRSDTCQSDFGSLLLREIRNKQDLDRLQAIRLRSNSLIPVIFEFCGKVLLESEDSADRRRDGSVPHFEREAFLNSSSFPFCKKTMLFRDCISGLDCYKIGEDFSTSQYYLQIRNLFINRLTELLSRLKKSNLIFNGLLLFDTSSSVKPEKGFPLNLKEDPPFTRIFGKKLGLPGSSNRFDLDQILPKYFGVSLGIPREVIHRGENTTSLNQLKRSSHIDSIYSRVRLYERNRVISLYSTYIFLLYDYFYALSTGSFSQIKYRLDGWAGNGEPAGVTRIATDQRLLEWKDNTEGLLNECINLRINEYRNVQSNIRRWLDTTEDLSSCPKGKIFIKMKYDDLDEAIYDVLKTIGKLLNSIGTGFGNTSRYDDKNFHQLLNVLFLYKTIAAEVTHQKVLVDTIDYCIEKLNNIDLNELNKINLLKLDLFSSLFDGYIDEQILFLKTILGRKKSFFIESRLLINEKSISSLTALELEPTTPVGLPRIESIRTGFSRNAFSITGRHFWNLFLHNLNCGEGSTRDIGESISRYISDEVNKPNFLDHFNLPIRNCAISNFLPKIKRYFPFKRCGSSYFNVLENIYVGSNNEAISSNVTPSLHPQLSDLLSSNFSKQAAGETADHVLTSVQSISSNLHQSATSLFSDGLSSSISDLNRLLARLDSYPREMKNLFISSCSNDGISVEEAPISPDPLADRRPRTRSKNMGLYNVNLEKFVEDGLDSKDVSTKNRFYQNDLSIGSFWESAERLETPYWSLRLPLGNDVTSGSLAGSIIKKILHEDTRFPDLSIQKEPTCASNFTNFKELSKDLKKYKISWIFWKDNISEKWSLFIDYIPWFFTPNWWVYFYNLIRETYPEVILKISYDSNHNLPRIWKRFAEEIDSAKAYLFRSLRQSLGFRFKNESISIILSKIDFLISEEIPDEAEMSHSGGWSVSLFSNRPIFYYFILSILFVFAFFKHQLSAVSGSNSFHSWKRFNTTEYLTDPTRRSYLRKVMHSPSTSQMSTRDLLIYSLNKLLNYVNNIIFYLFVKNGLDSWILRRESSDILDSNKELLTQYLVTNGIIFRYASKSNSNSDLLSNEISHEPYTQERSNILAYLLQLRQNGLSSYKIHKLDPAEKWSICALERNILFSVTTRYRGGILNVPCQDIPISLQSRLLPSRGILLIGPVETGRSSVIRDIAFNSYFPVVKLPLKKLIYNRSFFSNVRGNFISKESVHRLNLVFGIAKEVSPCTLWIQDIHELNIFRSYHKLEADPRFLLCLILKSIGHRRSNSDICNNILIASTHVPARIDPALIAPNRLNQLVNFRKSNRCQRHKELSILLRIKGFEIEENPPLLEDIGSGTMGYSKRDFLIFANEALLIGTSKRKNLVCSDAIGLALHRQHSTVTDMGNGVESRYKCKISSYEIAGAISKSSLINAYPTNIPFIGRHALKMRFYYLSNWYVEPSITQSTINEFALFSHILGLLAGFAVRDLFQMDIIKKENCIVIDKLVENDLNLACSVLENLLNNFSPSEICRGQSRCNNSLSPSSPIDKPKYCSGVTSSINRSLKFLRKGVLNSLTDFELQQSSELINLSPTEVPREITWSHMAWRFRLLRSEAYELIRVLSQPNHLYNLILLYQNHNYVPQRDFEFNRIKGDKNKGYDKRGYLFSFERSITNVTDKSIKILENRLDNMLLRKQFIELGISDDSSNEYETHCNRVDEPTRFFGGHFIWDPMLLFQPDPNIPTSRRSLLPTQEMARRLYIIYGMRRQRHRKFSNRKIRNFFLYRGDNPKLKPDSSIKRWNNLSLDEEERDSEYVKETSFVNIYLQYPQIFSPARLDCYIVAEYFPERFIRFRLLVHRKKWMRRNCSPFQEFLIYNMLFEIYQYVFNPFRFGGTSPD